MSLINRNRNRRLFDPDTMGAEVVFLAGLIGLIILLINL